MPHGGYGKRRVSGHAPGSSERQKGSGGINQKLKTASLKNQIRSTERLLRKELPPEVREALERKVVELKKQQELHNRLAVERKIFLHDKKIKFFERRKIERRIRRLEKQQRSSLCQGQEAAIAEALAKLKEDLEYVRFFPKMEKYVPLYCGGDNAELVEKRNKLRVQIKAKLVAAAGSGKDLEETGSEDDGLVDVSDDDFFISGSSSDEADADDEMTDISASFCSSSKDVLFWVWLPSINGGVNHRVEAELWVVNMESNHNQTLQVMAGLTAHIKHQVREIQHLSDFGAIPSPIAIVSQEQASTAAGKAASGMSSDERNQMQISARSLMPPPRPMKPSTSRGNSCTPINTSTGRNATYSSDRGFSSSQTGQSSNISSNSEASRRQRKRRPKKKN